MNPPAPPPHLPDRLELDFWQFHLAHPEVYESLRALAFRVKRQGKEHYSIKALYETLRLSSLLSSESFWINTSSNQPAEHLLNNNYTAFYARLLMQNEPKLRGFFRTRCRRNGKEQLRLTPPPSFIRS